MYLNLCRDKEKQYTLLVFDFLSVCRMMNAQLTKQGDTW